MKKTLIFLLVLLLAVVSVFPAAAVEEFEISGGVLVAYNGSSSEVAVPSGVQRIGDNAFSGNKTVTSVTLPSSVYSIGNRAFYDCSSLKTVKGTEKITQIGAYAFDGTALIESSETDFVSINHILIHYGGNEKTAQIPDGTVSIAPYAFAENTSVTSVTVPQSVVIIGEGAFYNCSALSSISIPSTVYSVGPFAFSKTAWLESRTGDFVTVGDGILVAYTGSREIVYLPSGIKQISGGALYGNTDIQQVYVRSGCLAVQIRAFADCPDLQRVYLPESIIGIDPTAFENSPLINISAESGSFAERFAESNSIPMDNSPFPYELGDVNGDYRIDATDATLVLQRAAGLISADSADFFEAAADVNSDGRVDATDATLLLQRAAGLLKEF